jgi:hypothetical protein
MSRAATSPEYRAGRRDGLREALTVLALQEDQWAGKVGTSPSARTTANQRIRAQAFKVAQTRVRTALNTRLREDVARGDEVAPDINTILAALGL